MRKIILSLSTLFVSLAIFSIDAASSTPQSETYIDVDFQLSCRTITLPISFSSIVADPNYLMDIHDYLEEQLCGEPNSGGGLKVEEDETNNDIVTP